MKTRSIAQGIATLIVLSGCSGPQRATDQQMRQIRSIEVVVEVPKSNFGYRQGDSTIFVTAPAGVSPGAALGAGIVANIVIAGLEHVANAPAREAQGPVGDTVKDLDLRGTTFEQLNGVVVWKPDAPRLTLSSEGFPKSNPEPLTEQERMAPPTSRPVTTAPMHPLIERAKTSQTDATLFIAVTPLFRSGGGRGAVVQSAAWLYDRHGKLLSEWATLFVGPYPPESARSNAVRWWADQRYRRFIAQGVRAVVLPIAESLTQPQLQAQRDADFYQVRNKAGDAVANGTGIYSTPCTVDSADAHVIYRYERQSNALHAGAYCPGESLKLWNPDLVPGLSWITQSLPAPAVVTKAPSEVTEPLPASAPASAPARRSAAR